MIGLTLGRADALEAASTSPVGAVDRRGAVHRLMLVLSIAAGSVDAIAFLGLGGLFPNHVTGNLVQLGVRVVGAGHATLATLLAVPVFVATVMVTTLLARGMRHIGRAPLRPLLSLHLLLLVGFLGLCLAAGPHPSPDARGAVVAGLVGVMAMAVQNALVQLLFAGSPATAVMTGNVIRLAIDLTRMRRLEGTAERPAMPATLLPVLGFAAGAALGAGAEMRVGLCSIALPVGLAVIALGIGFGIGSQAHAGR